MRIRAVAGDVGTDYACRMGPKRRHRVFWLARSALFCGILAACAPTPEYDSMLPLANSQFLPDADISLNIEYLSNCTHPDDTTLRLNSEQPVTVIVHGCFSSAGRFRSLADVFAFHGQQAVCFSYDDRASLTDSSAKLVDAVEALSAALESPHISVIGHSQGGLVARRAFIVDREDAFGTEADVTIDLTTISAPFGGIRASAHCGSRALTWLSLGLVKPVCQIITGSKYREIPPNSDFINSPGRLLPELHKHVKVTTDERDSCRRYGRSGSCLEDDYVFSLDEQAQPRLLADPGLATVTVKAGHVEIVGDGSSKPAKLIRVLQAQEILRPTPAEREAELAELLTRLYLGN